MTKTEQIRDLRKEFITWYKLKVADFEWIGEDKIADWWLQKFFEERKEMIDWCYKRCDNNIKTLGTDKWNGDLEDFISFINNK